MGAEQTAEQARPGLRLAAIELDEWDALGAPVRLELEPERTVLFGKNAAGKSVLLEGIFNACKSPLWSTPPSGPHRFLVELEQPGTSRLCYENSWTPQQSEDSSSDSEEPGRPAVKLIETCWRAGDREHPLWTVCDSRAEIRLAGAEVSLAPGTSLLSLALSDFQFAFPELTALASFFLQIRRVRAGVPRESSERTELFLRRRAHPGARSTTRQWVLVAPRYSARLNVIVSTLMRWSEENRDLFDEFCALGRKLHLFARLDTKVFKSEGGDPESKELASISFDDVNAGLLSDGTLRVIETLVQLLALKPGSLLLIEEPETAIHPGMLASLLHIIESYTKDRQLVFSTHSPLVVSHARARELRLVERSGGGVTTLRPLSDDESKRVESYLCDEGSLGDFVFSGGLDGDT